MNYIKIKFKTILNKLQRLAFKPHPNGHAMFHDLDDLISLKDNFMDYIKFEYTMAILYNIIISLPSLVYLTTKFHQISNCDIISTIWLILVTFIKLLELIPKGIIVYQTVRIENNSSDSIICCRRLMFMIRSNVFYLNNVLGNCILVLYTVYFLGLRRTNTCQDAPQFYYIINWLVFGFFLRLIISFVNYFLHFKYGINEADINSNEMFDYQNGVSLEVLNSIPYYKLISINDIDKYIPKSEENEYEECSICIYSFKLGETIRILPCDKKHVFHKICIDKWLNNHKGCPIDRKEINKRLAIKNKIYCL